MNLRTEENVFILYYILANGHVTMIGVYSTEANAERADAMAHSVEPRLKEEGVQGPFIEEVPFDDFFIGKDNFVDIEDVQ
ncbi:MAG: hypothetical protein J5804_03555 [Eggerthellaceae bacterium]|nr:hypothetical protein [Eggerthellaceae bacterium]